MNTNHYNKNNIIVIYDYLIFCYKYFLYPSSYIIIKEFEKIFYYLLNLYIFIFLKYKILKKFCIVIFFQNIF